MGDWCTIESDPGVFTELIAEIGVKNVQVEELYSLQDTEALNKLHPIYGFIFLFKYAKQQEKRECLEYFDPDLFFCNQVITNACATQALLAILLNNKEIETGQQLQEFVNFTKGMDNQTRGLALGNLELVRNAHNSFAQQNPFVSDGKYTGKEKEDVFHFISFIPFRGKVYELDGLQKGPIVVGTYGEETRLWLEIANKVINERISKFSETEIRFNLMAVVADLGNKASQKIQQLKQKKLRIYQNLTAAKCELNAQFHQDFLDLQNELKVDDFNEEVTEVEAEFLKNEIISIQDQIEEFQNVIEEEKLKKQTYKIENVRRKHNYIPFILELLKQTAKKGKLKELIEISKQKKKQKQQNQEKKTEN